MSFQDGDCLKSSNPLQRTVCEVNTPFIYGVYTLMEAIKAAKLVITKLKYKPVFRLNEYHLSTLSLMGDLGRGTEGNSPRQPLLPSEATVLKPALLHLNMMCI